MMLSSRRDGVLVSLKEKYSMHQRELIFLLRITTITRKPFQSLLKISNPRSVLLVNPGRDWKRSAMLIIVEIMILLLLKHWVPWITIPKFTKSRSSMVLSLWNQDSREQKIIILKSEQALAPKFIQSRINLWNKQDITTYFWEDMPRRMVCILERIPALEPMTSLITSRKNL